MRTVREELDLRDAFHGEFGFDGEADAMEELQALREDIKSAKRLLAVASIDLVSLDAPTRSTDQIVEFLSR